jgi:hypothetical protein
MNVSHLPREVVALTCSALVLGGGSPGAQSIDPTGRPDVARSFAELKRRIQPGATVLVTDAAGQEVGGTLSGLSDTSLSLIVNDTAVAIPQADVSVVKERRRDSLWNGLLIGAAAGAAPAVYWLLADPIECGGSICVSDLLVGVIPCAAIGAAIDAAVKAWIVVYSRPNSTTGPTLTLAPVVRQRGRGVEVTMSF